MNCEKERVQNKKKWKYYLSNNAHFVSLQLKLAFSFRAESIYGEYVEFQATLRADGFLRWEPGGIFKTMCSIDITFYPFDTQR